MANKELLKCKGKHRFVIKEISFCWYSSGLTSWHCDFRFL